MITEVFDTRYTSAPVVCVCYLDPLSKGRWEFQLRSYNDYDLQENDWHDWLCYPGESLWMIPNPPGDWNVD